MTLNDALCLKWEYEGPREVNIIGTTAAIIGGAIAAGGAVGSAAIQARAAGKAAKTQAEAAREAAGLYEPFREAGAGAVTELSSLLAPGGELRRTFGEEFVAPTAETLQLDPGYQFRLEEGQKALERSAAARGGLLTGGTARALTRYGQDVASQEYQQAYSRALIEYRQAYDIFQQDQANMYNRLMGLTQVGVTGARGAGEAVQMAGAAEASGAVGAGRAWGAGVQGATQSVADLVLLNSLLGQRPATQGTIGGQPYTQPLA